ncbi:AraC family transcriptional regulator [Pseudomonas chlororaphis subsp. piscium]
MNSSSCVSQTAPHALGSLLGSAGLPPDALLFESSDLEYAQEAIGKVYCPYRFTVGCQPKSPASMFRLPGESVVLSWFAYGADISIEPELFQDFVLVLTTLAGHAQIHSGHIRHSGGPGSTVVVAADVPSHYCYSADNVQMGVRLDARRVEAFWNRLSDRHADRQMSCVSVDPRQHQRWLASVEMLRQLLHPDTATELKQMLLPRAEELLIMQLVTEQLVDPNGDTNPLQTGRHRPAPAYLQRAIDFIDGHAERPLTLLDIATAACCSVRTLHRVFREWRNTGVMQYVREVRLQRVRAALSSAHESGSVTEIATRWGFFHLGQFAADYRKKYGELPSETRRPHHGHTKAHYKQQ